jgi:rRNA small subunit methyltransferase G
LNEKLGNSTKLMEAFREELIRWNRQINLVSRKDTDDRLAGLLDQSSGGFGVLADMMEEFGWGPMEDRGHYYFDLGSGGGLPGFVWHVLFSHKMDTVQSWLVEPREKRAWFLNRLTKIPGVPAFGVLKGRWGDVRADDPPISRDNGHLPVFIVSLKALHLDDYEVLSGLRAAFSALPEGFNAIIARFYPPGQEFGADLAKRLKIPAAGDCLEIGDYIYSGQGGRSVSFGSSPGGQASLVLSPYVARHP